MRREERITKSEFLPVFREPSESWEESKRSMLGTSQRKTQEKKMTHSLTRQRL